LFLDLERGDEGSVGMVDPFATLPGFFPIGAVSEKMDPPGKSAALYGPCLIDGASVVFQKDAIGGTGLID
jgi:hypothetical protein